MEQGPCSDPQPLVFPELQLCELVKHNQGTNKRGTSQTGLLSARTSATMLAAFRLQGQSRMCLQYPTVQSLALATEIMCAHALRLRPMDAALLGLQSGYHCLIVCQKDP